jgi:S-DNA-T family DNA segregation ATPase FtsK/SpoIIIE
MSKTSNRNGGNRSQSSDEDWVGELIWDLAKAAGHLLWWAVLFPAISVPVVIALVVAIEYGVNAGFGAAIGLAALYGLWALVDDKSSDAWVVQPVRRRFLVWWRYTRTWDRVCTLHGLTAKLGDRTVIPALRSVQIGEHTDTLDLRVVTGQSITHWQKQGEALAAAWRADRITIRPIAPGEVRVSVMRADVLANPVGLPTVAVTAGAAPVNLSAVRVGVTETRHWWTLPVLGHHLLVAGATGSGKGSVLWSLLAGIAPDVKSGRVRLCVIDPKGGMELGAGEPMFSFFSHEATGRTLDLLRALVQVMQQRAARLRGHTRLHTPTVRDPLFVVLIDEIAALTAYVTDRKARTEIEQLLGLLLSQGRAVGITVVAAIQDPSKDTLPVRQLFTVRIGLRMTEASQTAMVLGQGAREAGAHCDLIADATPGVGYVMVDGTAQPVRVRAFHVTDSDIATLAARYGRPPWRSGRDNRNTHGNTHGNTYGHSGDGDVAGGGRGQNGQPS